jgi:hypothetical protein
MNVDHVDVGEGGFRPGPDTGTERYRGDRPVGLDSDTASDSNGAVPGFAVAGTDDHSIIAGTTQPLAKLETELLDPPRYVQVVWANDADSHQASRSDGQFG